MPYIDANTVMWKEMKGRVVVLLLETGTFCELNDIGSRIWRMLAEGKNPPEIITALSEIYAVSEKKLAADVGGFISNMVSQGILQK